MKNGQCLCGEIKFKIESEARWIGACHCQMCRRQGGGAFQIWVSFHAKDLKFLSGQVKKFRSSSNVIRSSCPTCSSHLFFQYVDNDEDIYITAPSLDGAEMRPVAHIWWSSKLNWLCLNDGIETRFE